MPIRPETASLPHRDLTACREDPAAGNAIFTDPQPSGRFAGLGWLARRVSHQQAPWLWPAAGQPRPSGWLCAAAAGIYALSWGTATVVALLYVTGHWHVVQERRDWAGVFLGSGSRGATEALFVMIGCLLLVVAAGQQRAVAWPRGRHAWGWEAIAGTGWLVSLSFMYAATVLTPSTRDFPYVSDPSSAQRVMALIGTPLGGASEELWFGPVLVLLMRRRGWSWPAVLITAGVLRGAFHCYYGAPVWGFALWGLLAAAVYGLTGRWWVPMLLHLANDIEAAALAMGFGIIPVLTQVFSLAVLIGAVVYTVTVLLPHARTLFPD